MSRGLGRRQRFFLAALCKLEADEGRTGEFFVWAIVNAASKLGLNADAVAKRKRIQAERKAAALELEARASSGDVDAQERLHNRDCLERFEATIRGAFIIGGTGGAPVMRISDDPEDSANPSRILALLQQRGLIYRYPVRGRGSSACLTDAGRIVGQQALEDLANASPTPVEAA